MTQATTVDAVERLLAEPISAVIERQRTALDRLLEQCRGRVVLFGAGGLGRQTHASLRSIGVIPLAFSDNNERLWGTAVDCVDVLPPDVAAARFGGDALFIVTIWNPSHWYSETRHQLEMLGCTRITAPSPVYWRFADTLLPFYAQDLPQRVHEEAEAVLRAARIWSDEASREQYLQQIAWRLHGTWTFTRSDISESYFPPDVVELTVNESVIDCGAFDGDTLRTYLAHQGDTFRRYIAVEPDRVNAERLRRHVDSLSPKVRRRIEVMNVAVGSRRALVPFEQSATMGSKAVSNGGSKVLMVPISEIAVSAAPVTFIKMDIEGAEGDALTGARAIIERDRPVVAVCVYHTPYDIWRLPLQLREMFGNYRMFLRCHEGDGWQTVAYAIPPERLRRSCAQ